MLVRVNSDNQLTIEAALNSCLEAQFRLLASHTSSPATRLQRLSYYCLNSSKLACFLLWPNLISSYICSCVLRSSPSLWSLQIKLKGFHFRFGVCGLQIKDGTQKLQMDYPLSLSLSPPAPLSASKRTCLIGGNTRRSMQAYTGPIFSKQQEGGWGSSETTVAFLTPFPAKEPVLQGEAFSPPSMLCFCSYASCRECQERAGVLKQRSKEQPVWLSADLKASSATENSLKCLQRHLRRLSSAGSFEVTSYITP